MAEKSEIETVTAQVQTRRNFVKTAAQVAVTAPAATMLLNASVKPAKAGTVYQGGSNNSGSNEIGDQGRDQDVFTDDFVDDFDDVFIP